VLFLLWAALMVLPPDFLNGGSKCNQDISSPFHHLVIFCHEQLKWSTMFDFLSGFYTSLHCRLTVLFLLTFCSPGRNGDKLSASVIAQTGGAVSKAVWLALPAKRLIKAGWSPLEPVSQRIAVFKMYVLTKTL
jgi:hypothetical protein